MNTTNNATTISGTRDVGLGIFVHQGGSSRPEWLGNANTPEQATMPQTPHLSQQPTFDGPPPSFSLPINSQAVTVMPNTLDSLHTNGLVENHWMRRGGQYMDIGLGFLCLDDQTNTAFKAMYTAPTSSSKVVSAISSSSRFS